LVIAVKLQKFPYKIVGNQLVFKSVLKYCERRICTL